jgi:hypothetical protein
MLTNGNLDLDALARLGAQAEIEEHKRAIEALEQFLEGISETAVPAMRRARKAMGPAQRKAVSVRMKKYWRERNATA